MNFSTVIIAKDETKNLPRLVGSLAEFQRRGGEIVIADGGSTDGTQDLARSLGCGLFDRDDKYIVVDRATVKLVNARFQADGEPPVIEEACKVSDAGDIRNQAAALASNDMIFFPDADEAPSVMDLDRICSLIDEDKEAFSFSFVHGHGARGEATSKFNVCKLYDRRKLSWYGLNHEVVTGGNGRHWLDESTLVLEHYQDLAKVRGDGVLNSLSYYCHMHPDNARFSHYLGREMLMKGRIKSAMRELARHIAMNDWVPERSQSMIYMGDCCLRLKQNDIAADWYHRAFRLDPTRREALIRLAQLAEIEKRYASCTAYAAACLSIPWHGDYLNDASYYRDVPHFYLYWGYGWQGRIPEAREHILKALEYKPNDPTYLSHLHYYLQPEEEEAIKAGAFKEIA